MNRQELIDQVKDDILEWAAALGYRDVVIKTASSTAGTVVAAASVNGRPTIMNIIKEGEEFFYAVDGAIVFRFNPVFTTPELVALIPADGGSVRWLKDDPHGVDSAFSEIVIGEMVQFYQGYLESQVKNWQGEPYG